MHSATKFIGGHGTTIGGAIVDCGQVRLEGVGPVPGLHRARSVVSRRAVRRRASGRSPTSSRRACSCCATSARRSRRSTRSCCCRASRRSGCAIERHSANALRVAEFLRDHPKVLWVRYPGLPGDPAYANAQQVSAQRRRRDPHLRRQGRRRRGARADRPAAAVLAARERRRREVAGDPSGVDDAPAAHAGRPDRQRRERRRGAALGRHRVDRRHHRRPRPGARRRRDASPSNGRRDRRAGARLRRVDPDASCSASRATAASRARDGSTSCFVAARADRFVAGARVVGRPGRRGRAVRSRRAGASSA